MSTLKELCTIEYGKGLPERERVPGSVEVYGSAGMVGTHAEPLYSHPLIVVGRKGNISGVHKVNKPSWVIDTAYAIWPNNGLETDYLYFFLKYHSSQFSTKDQSTAVPSLARDALYSIELTPPSSDQQKAVVRKIRTLFAEIDTGVEDLTRTKEKLELYKQSVLNAAIQGKLVPQDPNDEPASTFLHQIRADKAQLTKDGKLRDEQSLPPSDQSEGPFEIPKGWAWSTIDTLCRRDRPISYGVIKLGNQVANGVPVLRSSNVRNLFFELDNVKTIAKQIADNFKRTYLEGGEVLITIRGTLGGVCVATTDMKNWNISREVAMLAPRPGLDSRFLAIYLASPSASARFKARLKGIAYTGINLEDLRELPVPLPPLDEQKRIVGFTYRVLQQIETNLTDLTNWEEQVATLRQSILKSAFKGELV